MGSERILRLKDAVEKSVEATRAARLRADKRRATRRGCNGLPEDEFKLVDGDWDRKRFTVRDVERWFTDQTREVFGEGMTVPQWRLKEKKLAKLMLDEFGAAMLEGVVVWLFRNWDGLVERSRGRLLGIPTIELLWSRRTTYISQLQKEQMAYRPDPLQSSRNADEFMDPEGTPDVGW